MDQGQTLYVYCYIANLIHLNILKYKLSIIKHYICEWNKYGLNPILSHLKSCLSLVLV
jgi:hypothetical protein